MKDNTAYTLDLLEIDKTMLSLVGGKAAGLGELCRIDGVQVPGGFCITTNAYKEIIGNNETFKYLLDQLDELKPDDRKIIGETSAKIREVIRAIVIPNGLDEEITRHVKQFGEKNAFAVRSSATAEDLPTASFAGQQETYLNIIGKSAILHHISQCWSSLFTDRAVVYRIQNGFDHRKVYLSVVIQKMIFSDIAGVMFTADPVNSNRKVLSIDASFGLGEALVSGIVNADNYKVCGGKITDKRISTKKLAVSALKDGGTKVQEIERERQHVQALTDRQILQLERIGREIEGHFGRPQDLEWCLVAEEFYIVQSRPITTLYPIPEVNDQENHVFVSVGHQQMMTDAMKPLGLSLWQLNAGRPMYIAGGRLFVDVAQELASPAKRAMLVDVLGKSDPLIKDILTKIIERGDFIKIIPDEMVGSGKTNKDFRVLNDYDPKVVSDLIARSETAIKELQRDIQTKSRTDLMDFIQENIRQLKQQLSDPQSFGVFMTAMNATSWINEKIMEWLGEKNVADTLTQSAPNNITSEMGLALLDLADVIRPYPGVIEYLGNAKDNGFLEELEKFEGGKEIREAFNAFLGKYGMRCAGEIDITRTRWSENPAILIPIILSNVKNFEPHAAIRKFVQGQEEASKKELELLERLASLPEGARKVEETKRMIRLVRNYIGYREYPKYSIVSRYFIYKKALLKEAGQLVRAGVIHEKEDIYFLSMEELREVIRTHKLDEQIIGKRKEEFKLNESLRPPRVFTSDGEIISGKYKQDHLPRNAIAGLAVSSGIIEGRARVILRMEDAEIEKGDILVTSFTDPSWTPLFVSIKGLVTEVGGLMTHGAVIAREYGLPAVVGVENATRLIKDQQRIRVNGTDGYVEIF